MEEDRKKLKFPKIAVLVSGSGTNLQAIIDDQIPVSLVLSDRDKIQSIQRAQQAGIKCVVIDRSQYRNQRELFTTELLKELEANTIELVILAGFMTIFTDELVHRFENRILNIHPSLLPSFTGTYGKKTMTATLQAGVKVTGTTVHIVTEVVDAGPILAQESVKVLDSDNEDTLQQRIQKVEHRLYPQTIRKFCLDNFQDNK